QNPAGGAIACDGNEFRACHVQQFVALAPVDVHRNHPGQVGTGAGNDHRTFPSRGSMARTPSPYPAEAMWNVPSPAKSTSACLVEVVCPALPSFVALGKSARPKPCQITIPLVSSSARM